MVSTLKQMHVPNGTGPGVCRSKPPLLASAPGAYELWNKVRTSKTVINLQNIHFIQ